MRLLSRALVPGLAAGAVTLLVLNVGASPTPRSVSASIPVADSSPGYAVEDFVYPQADKILQDRGIILKRGDGHIVLAECGSQEGLLRVRARDLEDTCFRVTGNKGYLSLEIPSVHLIKGNDYQTTVNMTVDEEEKTYDIIENDWTAVGEPTDPDRREHMLVEIVTSL